MFSGNNAFWKYNSKVRDNQKRKKGCKKTAQIIQGKRYLICFGFIVIRNIRKLKHTSDKDSIMWKIRSCERVFLILPLNYKRKSPLGVPCTPSEGFAASDLPPPQTDFRSFCTFFYSPPILK